MYFLTLSHFEVFSELYSGCISGLQVEKNVGRDCAIMQCIYRSNMSYCGKYLGVVLDLYWKIVPVMAIMSIKTMLRLKCGLLLLISERM